MSAHPLLAASLSALRSTPHLNDLGDALCRDAAVGALTNSEEALWRHGHGHLTASAFIVDACDRVLLTHHPKYHQWQQLGGHLEVGDATLAEAAKREALEESGLVDLAMVGDPVQLTALPVACPGPGSWHFDVRYAFASSSTAYTVSDESLDLRWFSLGDIPTREEALVVGARRAVQAVRDLRS